MARIAKAALGLLCLAIGGCAGANSDGSLGRVFGSAVEAVARTGQARVNNEQRERAGLPREQGQLQIVATRTEAVQGGSVVRISVRNGTSSSVTGLVFRITYLNGALAVAVDNSCGGPGLISPGQTILLTCALRPVQNSNGYRVDIQNAAFR
jgi:hypothetical protein